MYFFGLETGKSFFFCLLRLLARVFMKVTKPAEKDEKSFLLKRSDIKEK
jgi:hypothetical protein